MKKKIIVVAIIVVVVVLIVVAFFNLIRNPNEVEETSSTNVVSNSTIEEEKPNLVSIDESLEDTQKDVDMPSASPTPTISPTPSASPTPTISPTPSASPTSTTSPTPSASPTPTTSPTPNDSDNNSDASTSNTFTPSNNPSDVHISVVFGSIGTTSFGTTYPILSEFNKLALDPNSISWWNNDDVPDETSAMVGEANRSLGRAIGSLESTDVAFTLDGTSNIISCGSAWIERQRDRGQYLFVYGVDFTQLVDGGDLSREVIKVMLGTSVTSTPIEVEKALFEDCFGDNTILDDWTTIGDSKIKYVGYTTNGTWEYIIKPSN